MRAFLSVVAAVAVAVPVAAREQGVPIATPAGRPLDCIRTSDIRQTHVRSDQVIDFELASGRIYRNTLPYACPQLGFEERIRYTVTNGELCSVDTITVLQTDLAPGASCGLGQFQPVTLAGRP